MILAAWWRRAGTIVYVVGLIAASAVCAFAAVTSLVIIPTAQTVGAGNYAIQPEIFNPITSLRDSIWQIGGEIGIGQRWETGVDFAFGHGTSGYPAINGKYLFAISRDGRRAAGIGIQNVQPRRKMAPFVVARNDFRVVQFHLGTIGSAGHLRWFTGLDKSLGDRILLMADYTSGPENDSSLGVDYLMNEQWGVLVGLEFPNSSRSTIFTIQFTSLLPYTRNQETKRAPDVNQ